MVQNLVCLAKIFSLKTVTEMLEKCFKNLKKISGGQYPSCPPPPEIFACAALRAEYRATRGMAYGKIMIGKLGGGELMLLKTNTHPCIEAYNQIQISLARHQRYRDLKSFKQRDGKGGGGAREGVEVGKERKNVI